MSMLSTENYNHKKPEPTASQFSLEQLKKKSFFCYFKEEEWAIIKNNLTEYILDTGEFIFSEGDSGVTSQGIYFISKGYVSVSRLSLSGRNHHVRILEPGDIFFNPGLFDGGPSPATLKAVAESRVIYIPRHALIPVITYNPKAAEAAFEALADVIRQAISVIDDLAFKGNCSRLASLLLDVSNNDVVKRDLYTLQFISGCINTVPEVVSRELHKLAAEDLIEITRNQIKINNRKGLECVAFKS